MRKCQTQAALGAPNRTGITKGSALARSACWISFAAGEGLDFFLLVAVGKLPKLPKTTEKFKKKLRVKSNCSRDAVS